MAQGRHFSQTPPFSQITRTDSHTRPTQLVQCRQTVTTQHPGVHATRPSHCTMDAILAFERKEEDEFYAILGCDENSSTEQILAEYKVRVLQCHPDKHRDDHTASDRFARLQTAKETLCDGAARRDYDTWRRSGLALNYTDWRARREVMQASMHWVMKTKKDAMLEDVAPPGGKPQSPEGSSDSWTSAVGNQWTTSSSWQHWTPSEHITKFRNYEI